MRTGAALASGRRRAAVMFVLVIYFFFVDIHRANNAFRAESDSLASTKSVSIILAKDVLVHVAFRMEDTTAQTHEDIVTMTTRHCRCVRRGRRIS